MNGWSARGEAEGQIREQRVYAGAAVDGNELRTKKAALSQRAGRHVFGDTRTRRALERLTKLPFNFDRSQPEERTPETGWSVDHRIQPLPAEPPGPPVPDGSWEIARRLMRGYEFVDPSIVRAYYDPKAPLEGRNMLLEIRFLGLRFRVGTRVTREFEEMRRHESRDALVWGWSYATLSGHLEQGEMAWEVRKWLDSGAVEFLITAYSRRARIGNPIVRFGFRIFGRREQLRFYDVTCRRMLRLTEEALRSAAPGAAVHRAAEALTTGRAGESQEVHDKLARDLDQGGGGAGG
jgi:uncharacterized protein (UPF0548 family)